METYSRIGVVRSYENLQSYWTRRALDQIRSSNGELQFNKKQKRDNANHSAGGHEMGENRINGRLFDPWPQGFRIFTLVSSFFFCVYTRFECIFRASEFFTICTL